MEGREKEECSNEKESGGRPRPSLPPEHALSVHITDALIKEVINCHILDSGGGHRGGGGVPGR